jgi:hypothetical protein
VHTAHGFQSRQRSRPQVTFRESYPIPVSLRHARCSTDQARRPPGYARRYRSLPCACRRACRRADQPGGPVRRRLSTRSATTAACCLLLCCNVRPVTSAAQHQSLALPCFRLVSRAETKETRDKSDPAIVRGAFPTTRTLVLCAARCLLSLPLPPLPLPYRTVPIETHNSHRRFLSSTCAPTTQAAPLACPARL